VSHSSIVVLLAFFSLTTLGYVLRGGRITSDKIYAAICVYLLIGYAWTFAYAILDELQPGSFAATTEGGPVDYIARVMRLRYFSFATLTTVGYGDIVPRLPAARTLAMLEAITGQFYLAVLVARLVGLHIVHANGARWREKE
jgi:voltage-gated potassium channel